MSFLRCPFERGVWSSQLVVLVAVVFGVMLVSGGRILPHDR